MNKTCGDCVKCQNRTVVGTCEHTGITNTNIPACSKFERRVITNSDVIRAIVDNKKFAFYICEVSTKHKLFTADDLAEWLNAPAPVESEGEG